MNSYKARKEIMEAYTKSVCVPKKNITESTEGDYSEQLVSNDDTNDIMGVIHDIDTDISSIYNRVLSAANKIRSMKQEHINKLKSNSTQNNTSNSSNNNLSNSSSSQQQSSNPHTHNTSNQNTSNKSGGISGTIGGIADGIGKVLSVPGEILSGFGKGLAS